jgi:hypothetical protein
MPGHGLGAARVHGAHAMRAAVVRTDGRGLRTRVRVGVWLSADQSHVSTRERTAEGALRGAAGEGVDPMSQDAPHTHPCRHCRTPVECWADLTLDRERPAMVCETFRTLGWRCLCEACRQAEDAPEGECRS